MGTFVQVAAPKYVPADGSAGHSMVRVTAQSGPVYYGPDNTVTSGTGTLLSQGSSVTLSIGQWFTSGSTIAVTLFLEESPVEVESSGGVSSALTSIGAPLNVRDPAFGAKGDWQANQSLDASMTSGSNQLTVTSYQFTGSDVGKIACVKGAGAAGVLLSATITGVSAGKAVLSASASTTVSGKRACWGSDDTAALNAAFAAAAVTGNRNRAVYIPQGWYRFTQLVIPSGIKVSTAGWGNHFGVFYGMQVGNIAGTLLQQLEGAEKNAVVFTPQFTSSIPFIGPVDVELGTLEGPFNGTTGNGVYCGLADGTAARPQDGFRLRDTHVIGFPEDGVKFPLGLVPLNVRNLRLFYNRNYGLSVYQEVNGQSHMALLDGLSADGNGLAGLYFNGIQQPTNAGLVVVNGFKAEAHSLAQQNSVHEWTETGYQADAIVIEDCTNHFVISVDCESAKKDLIADPGGTIYYAPHACIVVKGTVSPSIEFNVSTRLLSGGSTDASLCVAIRDEINTVSVPKEIKSGYYTGKNASNYGGDRQVVAGPFARRLLTDFGDFVAAQNGFEAPGDQVRGPVPSRSWYETDGPTGSKHWGQVLSGGQLTTRAWDDTGANPKVVVKYDNASGIPRLSLMDDATGRVGFYGTTPVAKPTVTGLRSGNPGVAALLTQLAATGLLTDSTTAGVVPGDQGQPGVIAASLLTGRTNLTVSASRSYYARFVPVRDMTVTIVAFCVVTAAGADDACDVGIYDSTLTRIVSKGATTGLLNSTGIKAPTITSTPLTAGTVYYAGFSVGTLGGSAAVLFGTANDSNNNIVDIFGTANGKREAGYLNSGHPLGAGPITLGGGLAVPILAVRES